MDSLSGWFVVPLQILLVDLLLGADNALVIALACRKLPPRQMREAAAIGVGGAIFIRAALAFVASALLAVPLLKLIGALALIVIALNLISGEDFDEADGARAGSSLWSAAAVIIVADTTMSLDNVVALAAIAQNNMFWLIAGVALSLPIIAFGGVMLTGLLNQAPWLVELGAALLGWVALQMAVTDAAYGAWIDVNAPGLAALGPALGAAFVLLYGRFVAPRPAGEAVRPAPRPVAEVAAPRLPAEPPAAAATTAARPADFDPGPEPEDRHEPPATVGNRDDRLAIIGVLLLAVAAGAMLMVVSYLDSLN